MTILIVEDNPDHVFLARKAILQEMGSGASIQQVNTGEAALDYLRGVGDYAGAPRPDIILVDVQLPGRDGFWLLQRIKSDPLLKLIPVVIFTSSDAEKDVAQGYTFGANVYVCKPTGSDEFGARLRAIPAFWSRVAQLPPRQSTPSSSETDVTPEQ